MNCVREDLKIHITDVLVGEAEPALGEQVLSHLETCASCREDRDQVSRVLGLLKDSPPWVLRASDDPGAEQADSLSVIQRQKLQSLALPRSSAPRARRMTGLPTSWLALAASLSAVGIALFMARRGGEPPLERPVPAKATSSVHELPQATEGPMLEVPPRAVTQDVTAPARGREEAPDEVAGAPEAIGESRRQARPDDVTALAQAMESNRAAPEKMDRDHVRDEPRVSAGKASGVPAEPAYPPEVRLSEVPAPPASAPVAASGRIDAQLESGALGRQVGGVLPGLSKAEADARRSSEPAGELPRPGRPVPPPAPRDMFFEAKGTNPFIVTEEDPQSTFGLDVDTASYTLTRNYLNRGVLPPAAAVRVEEFVNSFPNDLVTHRGGSRESVFAVRVDGAPNPLHPGYHILRVAMKAKEVDPRERKAAHLTFVIDVSGSMAAENRLGLVKQSLALLVDKLDERDTIGIVVYGTSGRRVLAPTSVESRDRILGAIDRLAPEGSTNLQDGLDLGYEMAMESFTRGASNRVVLCTDGVANTGRTEADALLARIRAETERGIDMMALGFGMGNYNDALLQRLADEGNGQYAYIDDLGEARAFFLRKLAGVLEVVARDAKAQVEFNPARVERYRLLGYEKRDIADRDFRNDSVDAGEINSGHSVTALFEVKLKGRVQDGRIGTARIRYKTGPRSEGVEFSREIEDRAVTRSFDQASPAFRTAYVAARFAEHLRKSYWVKDESLALLQPLADALPEGPPANELADLIGKAARLQKPRSRED